MTDDERFMRLALALAERAQAKDEVPVGALVVQNSKILGAGYNLRERRGDPLAHAEIRAIERARRKIRGWRMEGCTLYVTLEPCPMCAGAAVNARIPRIVFGAFDPKAGALGSVYNLAEGKLNHTPEVVGGVLREECATLLTTFFRAKR